MGSESRMTYERAILGPALFAVGGVCWLFGLGAGLTLGIMGDDIPLVLAWLAAGVGAGLVTVIGGCLCLALRRQRGSPS